MKRFITKLRKKRVVDIDESRRSFMKAAPIMPIAAVSAAEEMSRDLTSKLAFGKIVKLPEIKAEREISAALWSDFKPNRKAVLSSNLEYLKRLRADLSKADEQRRLFLERTRVKRLDADIIEMRSLSLSAKMRMQRDRVVNAQMDRWLENIHYSLRYYQERLLKLRKEKL